MEQEKKTAGMPCPPCKSAPFSRAVKPAAQENAVQEAAAPLGAPGQYGGSAVGRTEKTPGFTGVDAAFACGFLAVGWLFWELQLWSGWRYCFAWGLAMHCPTAADCWEPSITARCCSQRNTGR